MSLANRQRLASVLSDFVMTNVAVLLFNIVRYYNFSNIPKGDLSDFLTLRPVILGQIVMPLLIMLVYYLSGYYYNPVFRSRVEEFFKTLGTTLIGALLFYFIVLINDPVDDRGAIYEFVGCLWGLLFGAVYPFRLFFTCLMLNRIQNSRVGYDTLIVGTSQAAHKLVRSLGRVSSKRRFNVVGLVACDDSVPAATDLPVYPLSDIEDVIRRHEIQQLIVVPHRNGMQATLALINSLFPLGVQIYVSPTLFYMISGRMPVDDIVGEPLVNISRPSISPMTASLKRFFDIVVSILAIILLLPLYAAIAIAIRYESDGPVFFLQERVGMHKHLFNIVKFRTMRIDAEDNGPALSSPCDPRVTRVGRILRKYRLDELPQFWNVIKGEMSIVGPRPERRFYADQITRRVPYYSLVHQLRPGITSLGMVKFGYAENVDEMIERLKYDLIYIENVSLAVDMRIIIYTFSTVINGRGV